MVDELNYPEVKRVQAGWSGPRRVSADFWHKDSSKGEQEDGNETCCYVCFGVGGTDKTTGGQAGGGRVEDVKISFVSE